MDLVWLYIYSYLIGSVPTAYIIGKLVKGVDIRNTGSGNVGGLQPVPSRGKTMAGASGAVRVVGQRRFFHLDRAIPNRLGPLFHVPDGRASVDRSRKQLVDLSAVSRRAWRGGCVWDPDGVVTIVAGRIFCRGHGRMGGDAKLGSVGIDCPGAVAAMGHGLRRPGLFDRILRLSGCADNLKEIAV